MNHTAEKVIAHPDWLKKTPIMVINLLIYSFQMSWFINYKILNLSKLCIPNLFCVSVIAASFREIEDRIDRQIWKLPQELFREHMQPAMYEVIVEKYKGRNLHHIVKIQFLGYFWFTRYSTSTNFIFKINISTKFNDDVTLFLFQKRTTSTPLTGTCRTGGSGRERTPRL